MKNSSSRVSYVGKTVFVGIDVHKKHYSVVAIVEGEVVKKWKTPANSAAFADQLLRYFAEATIKTVYEAGFSGFVLHRDLEVRGIENIVINPASIEVAANNRVKTDKRDALKMATLLEAGRLKGIRIPSQKEEQRRFLSRTRQQLVEQRQRLKNQIRMKAHQMGLIEAQEHRVMSHKLVEELLEKSPCDEFTWAIVAEQEIWKSLDLQIKKIELKLSRVRYILNQVAWRALKLDPHLKEFFERLHPKTGKKKAIVAVARKLIGRIRAAFRKNVLYQINPVISPTLVSTRGLD